MSIHSKFYDHELSIADVEWILKEGSYKCQLQPGDQLQNKKCRNYFVRYIFEQVAYISTTSNPFATLPPLNPYICPYEKFLISS